MVASDLMKNVILGSQSPQRFDLLQTIVSSSQLSVLPPTDDAELGFEDCKTLPSIEVRLEQIVDGKMNDVSRQVQKIETPLDEVCVVCADTIVVACRTSSEPLVLGKPPTNNWQSTVKDWFVNYYSNRSHDVWTCLGTVVNGQAKSQIVKTTVEFSAIDDWWIDWYLATNEPIGKAGGYGIQGHAAALVNSITGSLTNVIGLPMFELAESMRKQGIIANSTKSLS